MVWVLVEEAGLEPAFPVCRTGVLPLDDSPEKTAQTKRAGSRACPWQQPDRHDFTQSRADLAAVIARDSTMPLRESSQCIGIPLSSFWYRFILSTVLSRSGPSGFRRSGSAEWLVLDTRSSLSPPSILRNHIIIATTYVNHKFMSVTVRT